MLLQVFFLSFISALYCMPTGQPDLSQSCLNMTWACHDIGVAMKCEKFSNCIEIWEKIKAPQDNNEICDICKDMVKQARDQLLSNETQEEMKEVFEGSCDLLPIKAVAAECRKVVDEIVPQLIEMLASRMDPTMVCTVAGLCNNGKLAQLIKDQYIMSIPLLVPVATKANDCNSCKQGMKFVRKALHLIPKSDFTSLLLHTCVESFHGTTAECTELISKLLPVYDFMLLVNEDKLCSPLGKCGTFKPSPMSQECGLCRNFVGATRKLTKSNTAISAMKSYILDICDQIEFEEAKQKQCKMVVNGNFDSVIYLLWTKEDSSDLCFRTCQKSFSPVNLKKQLVADMNNLCKKTGEFQSICQSFVDQYFNFIYNEFVDHLMDPQYLCRALKMCPNDVLNLKVSHMVCHICDAYSIFSPTIKDSLILKIVDSVESHLKGACSKAFKMFPSKSCEDFMKEVAPIIFNFLKVVSPETFCGQMTVCPMTKPLVKGIGDNMTCEFCEALVTYLKNIVQSQTTKEEFRTALKNFCADLKEFSDQCTALVDEYFDQAYNFLINNLNPPEVCGALGLCNGLLPLVATIPAKTIDILPKVHISPDVRINSKPAARITKARRPLQSQMPGIKIQAAKNTRENKYKKYLMEQNSIPLTSESNSVNEIDIQQLPVERFMPQSLVDSEALSMNCEVCKTLISYLENELKDPKEEAEIRKVLEEACSVFPAEMVNQCKDFIETNMDYLITLILQEATPEMICSLIKACPKTENSNFLPCELCKKVMEYLDHELADNRTEEAIKNALDKACSYMPKSWAAKCTAFVDEYSEMIINLITHDVAPTMVCAAMGLCPLEHKVEGEMECTVCQYVLHYLQEQLMDNATEDEIKAELNKVCSVMPKTLADNCNAFIDEFGSSLLVLLAQKLDPSVVCVNFKICPGKGIYSHETLASHTIKSLKLDTCSTCQMIVDYMDKLLENDDVDTEITKLIEKICNIIPMASRDQCAAIIETYGPYVLQMIGQLSNSKEVCQAVDLCSRTSGHIELLGGEKCTYGPSYWCQSSAHASACNAEPFCKKQVWKN